MAQKDWFESWFASPYYKALYQNRDELEAQAFVDKLIDYLQPLPGSRMLDIACGEGRFSIKLSGKGYDVTGIDLSLPSIEKAKLSEKENLQFFVHDMRFPFYINYFDYAFNFFTSFGYFRHQRDNLMAAKSFAAALRTDGMLVMDYLNRDYVISNLVPEDTIIRGKYRFDITRHTENNHIVKTIRVTGENGLDKTFEERVTAFSLSAFVQLFRKAGLSVVATFGDYKLHDYDPLESQRMIVVFKK